MHNVDDFIFSFFVSSIDFLRTTDRSVLLASLYRFNSGKVGISHMHVEKKISYCYV